jgi:outer membrane protein TolC
MVTFPNLCVVVLLLAPLPPARAASPRTGPTATVSPAGDPRGPPCEELILSDALADLERANPTLAQSRARADEARGVVRQARAALFPTLTAQGTLLRNDSDAVLAPPGQSGQVVIQPLHSGTVTATGRVPILAPSAWFQVAAAREGAASSEALLEAARRNLRSSFTESAHASRAAEDLVAASATAVANAADLERSAARKLAAGTSTPLDRLRAETERVRRESELAQARADLERSRLALGVLLGRARPVRVIVPEVAPAEAPDPAALAAAAPAARPEMTAQRAQVSSAEAQVRSAWALLAPQVSASASWFASTADYPTGARDGWRATLDLTWTLYDGGFRSGKWREAEAQLAFARAGETAQRLGVLQEVEDASRDVAVARERLRLAESQRKLSADAAATALRGFEAGVSSSLDVIDANDRLYAAEVGLAEARARVAQAAVALDRAAGR